MTFSLSSTHRMAPRASTSSTRMDIATLFKVWVQRRELAQLDVKRLKDLGITPAQAKAESSRWFWYLPCA